MEYLWSHGFYGKGSLSRSEPSWETRTSNRLGLKDGSLSLEEITRIRRDARLKFKEVRAQAEQEALALKQQGVRDTAVSLKEVRDKEVEYIAQTNFREEDHDILDGNGNVIQMEYVELMPCEVYFLCTALKCCEVFVGDRKLSENEVYEIVSSTPQFHTKYAAYHHYRSLGWCVRSGIKFGTDFLLYRRGPPFTHAEYAVMVMDSKQQESYTWFSSIARVVGGVRKTLVFSYIEVPDQKHDFSQYKVHEVMYKRWVPGKNRD